MLAVADFLAQRAKEVRTDAVGAARIDRVARGALREHRLALRRVGGGEQIGERHGRFAAAGASLGILDRIAGLFGIVTRAQQDRKSTRLNLQSLMRISYAVFCLKKKTYSTSYIHIYTQ